MRPSLLPGLVRSAQTNADRGFADVALFEVWPNFQRRPTPGSVDRRQRAAPRACFIDTARAALVRIDDDRRSVDAKADALAVLVAAGRRQRRPCKSLPHLSPKNFPAWLHPGRFRRDPDWAAKCAGLFRRIASPRARNTGRGRTARWVRSHFGSNPGRKSQAHARQTSARSLVISARVA